MGPWVDPWVEPGAIQQNCRPVLDRLRNGSGWIQGGFWVDSGTILGGEENSNHDTAVEHHSETRNDNDQSSCKRTLTNKTLVLVFKAGSQPGLDTLWGLRETLQNHHGCQGLRRFLPEAESPYKAAESLARPSHLKGCGAIEHF